MPVLNCNCVNDQQDAIYGKGNRVHNPTSKAADSGDAFRCTSCKKTRGRKVESVAKKDNKKKK
jgi:transposase-like protein